MKQPKDNLCYVAIRKNEAGEYFDYSYMSCLPEQVAHEAAKNDKNMPGWASANPVQRIARVKLIEQTA